MGDRLFHKGIKDVILGRGEPHQNSTAKATAKIVRREVLLPEAISIMGLASIFQSRKERKIYGSHSISMQR